MLLDDDIRPVYTSVVRLKSYGKGEDVHYCKNKRPHLMVLTPDAVQLFTTLDAGPAYTEEKGAMNQAALGALSNRAQYAMSLVTRSKPSASNSSGESVSGAPSSLSLQQTATGSGGTGDDPEDLSEGQVFRLGVALSQILAVQVVKENRVRVLYQPNRPSKKGSVEEQTLVVLRTLLSAVDMVSWNNTTTPPPPLTFPHAHHFSIVAPDGFEARNIRDEIERAQRQLAFAVLWLSEGLPLREDSRPTMVTVGPKHTGPGSGPSGASPNGYTTDEDENALPSAVGTSAYTVPFPSWGQNIQLPPEACSALASPNSRRLGDTVITIYLSTPLGSATAEIPLFSLIHSTSGAGAPMLTQARLQDRAAAEVQLRPGKRWMMNLQWKVVKGDVLSESGGMHAASSSSARDSGLPPARNRNAASREVTRSPGLDRRSGVGMGVLLGLAALSGVAAVARTVRAQIARIGSLNPKLHNAIPTSEVEVYQWHLVLLDLTIEEEMVRVPASSPPVRRALSISVGAPTVISQVDSGLPEPFYLLVKQYPSIVTPDIARRFLIGLGSEAKAYAALSSMARWTTENNLADIVSRPQRAFHLMKKYYPHGFPGWSRKRDCLVELECMGAWPGAYTKILSEGISEQEMLEHLLFIYHYAFSNLDSRPLPNGKTVKIVDLEGLTMGDLNSPGFKLITRVGAMLSLNFPQRLHKCFLVNAPGWWTVAWRLILPIIPPKVRGQMTLLSKNDKEGARRELLEWVDPDVLPVKYGGNNAMSREQWTLEVELEDYVNGLASQESFCKSESP